MKRLLGLTALWCLLTTCGDGTVGSRYVKSGDVDAARGATIVVTEKDSPLLAGTALEIAPGALTSTTYITLEIGFDALGSDAEVAGPPAVWGPSGTRFQQPVRMTLPVTRVEPNEELFVRVREGDGATYELPPSAMTRGEKTVSFFVAGFTTFQAMRRVRGLGDAGVVDAGAQDAGTLDAGARDAGAADAGVPDAGAPDAGVPDAGTPDAGPMDAGEPDAGAPDAGESDAGVLDAGLPDAGEPDAGALDGGRDGGAVDGGSDGGANACAGLMCLRGEVCVAGVCLAECGLTLCNLGEVCMLGACQLDPLLCGTVRCPRGQTCISGMCQ